MNCKKCNLIEMLVMARNNKEVIYQCPKCLEISKVSVEEEQETFKESEVKDNE